MLEETGLTVDTGRLACGGLPPAPAPPARRTPLPVRLRHRGPRPADRIVLQAEEISEYRWATPERPDRLLSGPVGRRVGQALAHPGRTLYLEDGRPVRVVITA